MKVAINQLNRLFLGGGEYIFESNLREYNFDFWFEWGNFWGPGAYKASYLLRVSRQGLTKATFAIYVESEKQKLKNQNFSFTATFHTSACLLASVYEAFLSGGGRGIGILVAGAEARRRWFGEDGSALRAPSSYF